jgi:hypothetical protein
MGVEVEVVVMDQKMVNDLEVMVVVEVEVEAVVVQLDNHQQYPCVEYHNYRQVFYYD